jgi:light-regulated signal transduction histidine kinase (bacteriophytochrome)
VQEFLGYIVDAVRRMSNLLNDLLVYSQVTEGRAEQTEDVNCETVLTATLMNLDSAIQESKAKVTHDPLPTVPFDFARLTQVFQNLVSNAVKYRRADTEPRIHVSAAEGANEWTFGVSDNGLGIDPRYREQVFGVFKRLHGKEFPGTGMGLAIVKKIIERRGGRVWVESSLNTGSTFHFTIPK